MQYMITKNMIKQIQDNDQKHNIQNDTKRLNEKQIKHEATL